MSVCATHYRSSRNHVGFHWKKPSFRHLISCCQLGVSAFVGELSSGVIAIVFNFLILGIAGNVGVAAYGVAGFGVYGVDIWAEADEAERAVQIIEEIENSLDTEKAE